MVQAYNTWLAEDYSAPAPDRLIGNALMPISGIDDAIAELERAHDDGVQDRAARPATRTAAAARSPKTTGSGRSRSSSAWRCRRTSASAAPINIGGPRHDTSQWPAGSGHDAARAGPAAQHDGADDRARRVRPDPRAAVLLRGDQRRALPRARSTTWTATTSSTTAGSSSSCRGCRRSTCARTALYGMVREPLAVRDGRGDARGHAARPLPAGGATSRTRSARSRDSQDYIKETFAGLDDELRRKILVGNAADHLGLDLDADITETP